MKISKIVLILGMLAALNLVACAQPGDNAQVPNTGAMTQTPETMMGTETPDAMMGTPTGDAMMDKTPDGMMATPTGDTMMDKTPDGMMGTPTGGAMMDKTPDAMMGTPTGDTMMDKTPDAMMGTPTGDAMMEAPVWFSTPLTDVSTGQAFTINDFKGKVVVVQNIVAGCAACLEQGKQLQSLREMLGDDSEVVFVGLDGSAQADAAALKAYVEENGFDGSYAIAPQEMIDEVNSPSEEPFFNASTARILIIDTKGAVHPLEAGMMSAEDLKKTIEMYTGM